MEDTREDIFRKINGAFCPDFIEKENPVLDYCKHIILPSQGELTVISTDRDTKISTTHFYTDYAHLLADYVAGTVAP